MSTTKKQGSIATLFAAKKTTTVAPKRAVGAGASASVSTALTSTNVDVQTFYDELKPYERIAHEIAVEKLGTSYDVTRTHGFLRWKKARGDGAK